MKFFRDSIAKKFVFFIFFIAIVVFGGYFALAYLGKTEVPTLYLFWGMLGILFFLSFFFYWMFFLPLMRVAREVKLLLTGKEFHKVKPSTIDEIGVFTYFFNTISSNLEKIASDIENNERLISELDIASDIQRDVLPKTAPDVDGLDIVANTIAAAEVGGDSFDIMQYQNNTYLYVGDVTGHGVPAGLVMMMVNTLLNVFCRNGYSTKEMIVQTNTMLLEKISSSRFMTLLMLRWDATDKQMYWVGAGHEHVLVYRAATKEVEAIRGGGIALRMAQNIEHIIEEKKLRKLEVGDVVLLYTDGITEAKNPDGEMYTVERLVSSLQEHGHRATAEGIFDAISQQFSAFILNAPQLDDITMIIAKRLADGQARRTPIKLSIKAAQRKEKEETITGTWGWEKKKKRKNKKIVKI